MGSVSKGYDVARPNALNKHQRQPMPVIPHKQSYTNTPGGNHSIRFWQVWCLLRMPLTGHMLPLQVLLLDQQMQELARRLMNDGSLLLFGRGYNYATALEAALKVKEVALMHRHVHTHSDSICANTGPSGCGRAICVVA